MKPVYIFILLLTVAFTSCTPSATIQNEWSNPEQKVDSTKHFQKILFVALVKNVSVRRITEDKLVKEVNGRGVASYSYLGNMDMKTDENVLSQKLKQDGFDGVVVMRLTSADKNAAYVPGTYPAYYNSWYGYYSSTYPRFNDPNYYPATNVYNVETTVYSLNTNKLVWTGVTSAVNLSDKNKMIDGVIAAIKQKMKSQGLIK
jgi:hypothetical protein